MRGGFVNINGVYREMSDPSSVRINNVWRNLETIHANINGVYRIAHTGFLTEPQIASFVVLYHLVQNPLNTPHNFTISADGRSVSLVKTGGSTFNRPAEAFWESGIWYIANLIAVSVFNTYHAVATNDLETRYITHMPQGNPVHRQHALTRLNIIATVRGGYMSASGNLFWFVNNFLRDILLRNFTSVTTTIQPRENRPVDYWSSANLGVLRTSGSGQVAISQEIQSITVNGVTKPAVFMLHQ